MEILQKYREDGVEVTIPEVPELPLGLHQYIFDYSKLRLSKKDLGYLYLSEILMYTQAYPQYNRSLFIELIQHIDVTETNNAIKIHNKKMAEK